MSEASGRRDACVCWKDGPGVLFNFLRPRLSSLLLTMETPISEASAGETDKGCLGAQTSGTFFSASSFLFSCKSSPDDIFCIDF